MAKSTGSITVAGATAIGVGADTALADPSGRRRFLSFSKGENAGGAGAAAGLVDCVPPMPG